MAMSSEAQSLRGKAEVAEQGRSWEVKRLYLAYLPFEGSN